MQKIALATLTKNTHLKGILVSLKVGFQNKQNASSKTLFILKEYVK